MQLDFHYYATYCAAYLAGYTHDECMEICYSAQFTDLCSRTLLSRIKGPLSAATTQLSIELLEAKTNSIGIHDITRIWASFHFLPKDLYAEHKGSKWYKNKYRLICGPNGDLLLDTVELAKGKTLQAAGIAMHVLADTWAHRYFAGTPSMVINNTNYYFYEVLADREKEIDEKIVFGHSPSKPDVLENRSFMASINRFKENSIMVLGHGRAGHLPDYSFMKYKYLPAWADYEEVIKDNPSDYYHAFCQMVYALQYLHGEIPSFEKDTYAFDCAAPYEKEIKTILTKRQLDASEDWKAFGEKLSGRTIEPFDMEKYTGDYVKADAHEKEETFLGRYFLAALAHKSMVTNKIFTSGNKLAGYSVDYEKKGFKGNKDFKALIRDRERRNKHE